MKTHNCGNWFQRPVVGGFWAIAAGSMLIGAGCSSTHEHEAKERAASAHLPPPLRVGITPDYPPLVFRRDGMDVGAEIDLAHALGKELNRPVEFVTLRRADRINALQDGTADIIMSGLSVTQGREVRASFTAPYLQNQIRAIFRRTDAAKYQSAADVTGMSGVIGVLPGTTSDIFVQKNCPNAQRLPLQYRKDAVFWLTDGGKIDLYVDDMFALVQMVSEHEASLGYLPEPLAFEGIAWAVAPSNGALLQQVNDILARWKTDGTLDSILLHWMPYLKK